MTNVQCLMQGVVIYSGAKTATRYVFNNENNHILPVDDSDIPDILAKRDIQGGCCNAPRIEKPIFIIIE